MKLYLQFNTSDWIILFQYIYVDILKCRSCLATQNGSEKAIPDRKPGAVCSKEGLTLETSTTHQIP